MRDKYKTKRQLLEELAVLRKEIAALEMKKQESSPRVNDSYRNFFLKNDAVMLLIDPRDGSIVGANQSALRFYRYSQNELLKTKIQDINTLPPQEVARELERAGSRSEKHFFFRHRLKGGEIRDVEVYTQPIEYRGKEVLYSIIHDVSDQKRAEKALRQSEERLRLALESGRMGAWDWEVGAENMEWSEGHFTLLGQGVGEVEPNCRVFRGHIHPEDLPRQEQALREALENKKDYCCEYRVVWPDGSIHWVESRGRCIFNGNGRATRMYGVLIDIDQKKQSEKALRRSEELHRAIARNFPNGAVYVFDQDMRYLVAEGRGLERLGLSKALLEGRTVREVLDEETCQVIEPRFRRVLSGESLTFETKYRNRFLLSHYLPLRDEANEIIGGLAVSLDITERKQLEDEVRRREEEFRALVENAPDVIAVFDRDMRRIYVNEQVENNMGRTAASLRGKHILDSGYSKSFSVPFKEALESVFLTGQEETVEVFDESGERIIWQQIRFAPLRGIDGSVERVMTVGRDITGQKQADEELRKAKDELEQGIRERTADLREAKEELEESQKRFREVLETSLDVCYRQNLQDGRYDYISPRVLEITGYTPEEISSMEVLSHIHPADLRRIKDELKGRSKENYRLEFRFRHKDGPYKWLSDLVAFVKDSRGEKLYQVGSIRDISEQKKAEEALESYASKLEDLNSHLEKTNKKLKILNNEMQDFVYVASHDLQEPLRKIQMFGDLLKDEKGPLSKERRRDYLQRMQSAAERMRAMLDGLLDYSRVTTRGEAFTKTDLSAPAKKALKILDLMIRETGAKIELGVLPVIEADLSQMVQLFRNLLENALKFRRKEIPPEIKICSECTENERIQILVEDNGIGFNEKYVEHIFAPFERLHGKGDFEGIGMGLAICRKIVERHGGTISAKSKPGKGTTFVISLHVGGVKEAEDLVPLISPETKHTNGNTQSDALKQLPSNFEEVRSENSSQVGYVTLKRTGTIIEADRTAANILGVDTSYFLTEWPLKRFVAPQNLDRYYEFLSMLLSSGTVQDFDLDLIRPDGSRFHASLTSIPERDKKGEMQFIRVGIIDRTQFKGHQDRIGADQKGSP